MPASNESGFEAVNAISSSSLSSRQTPDATPLGGSKGKVESDLLLEWLASIGLKDGHRPYV
jgi:hypothetical protein